MVARFGEAFEELVGIGMKLDFMGPIHYKYLMQITEEIRRSLKREYVLCSNAIAFYKGAIKNFEQKYHLSTRTFLKKFGAGQIGDDADYFDWYAFANLLAQWQKTQSAIHSAIQ